MRAPLYAGEKEETMKSSTENNHLGDDGTITITANWTASDCMRACTEARKAVDKITANQLVAEDVLEAVEFAQSQLSFAASGLAEARGGRTAAVVTACENIMDVLDDVAAELEDAMSEGEDCADAVDYAIEQLSEIDWAPMLPRPKKTPAR